jgi:PBP1b-binding outer membrane lipoprotein LpoB
MKTLGFAAMSAALFLAGCSNNGESASTGQDETAQVASTGESKKGNAFKQFAINSLFGSMTATADAAEANHRMAQRMK